MHPVDEIFTVATDEEIAALLGLVSHRSIERWRRAGVPRSKQFEIAFKLGLRPDPKYFCGALEADLRRRLQEVGRDDAAAS